MNVRLEVFNTIFWGISEISRFEIGIFGFTGIASGAASIAKVLFVIFLVLFIAVLIFGGKLLGK